MSALKRISNQIELNRQRLHHAIETKNESLAMRTLSLLTHLHSLHFDETKKAVPMSQVETKLLVFSADHEDGRVLTRSEYRELTRRMTAEDRATHVAVEVDLAPDVAPAVEQALVLNSKRRA